MRRTVEQLNAGDGAAVANWTEVKTTGLLACCWSTTWALVVEILEFDV
jgi:hypothetical protein